MTPQNTLIIKTAALARSSPNAWQDFMAAFAAYQEVCRTSLVNSPLDNLPNYQGRAQQMAVVHELFANCIENADKIAGKA